MLDTSKGAKPLYMQVKETIESWIQEGKWKPGELIPAEAEFQTLFGVSRITVRQAIQELVNENLLSRKSGVGTRVLEPISELEKYSTVVKSAPHEMKEIGHNLETHYFSLRAIKPTKKLAELFSQEALAAKKLFQLDRVRGYSGKEVVFSETYLNIDLDLAALVSDSSFSLYKTLQEQGLTVARAEEKITVALAGKAISAHLDIDKNDPVLIRERLSRDASGTLFEYTICYYNPALYSYNVEVMLLG